MKRFALLTALCLILLPALAPAQPLPVVTGIEPVQYFVQRIGGDMVDVSVMVGPGDEPHSYEPKPSQMTAIAKARLYVAIGVGFENVWLPRFKAANPDLAVVQADMGITKMPMAAHRHGHEHKAESGHGHASLDPHIWTSPALVRNIARTIHLALAKTDPANRKAYEANYETFLQEVDLLDSDLRHLFAKVPEGAPFMVYHPAWGYFAREFHLNQIPVEKEGKAPRPPRTGRARGLRPGKQHPRHLRPAPVLGEISAHHCRRHPRQRDQGRPHGPRLGRQPAKRG
nr:zinc ABC transporter substrate-binding protein [Pseudodesulfovibrio tunisiensis]